MARIGVLLVLVACLVCLLSGSAKAVGPPAPSMLLAHGVSASWNR